MSEERTALSILKKYWGYNSFKLNQESIISSVLSNNDTLGLMPTGGGKSLCYQVPALVKRGVCIVISPLISLMIDQVEDLKKRGISARYICSGMTRSDIEIILNNCLTNRVKILYVSPERLGSDLFISNFKQMKISLIAVDEAHSISQWGYDFRPSYMKIAEVRTYHPDTPILALTASATKDILVDICENLRFKNINILSSSFERDNLVYTVYKEEENNKIGKILKILDGVEGSGIIYVRTRNKASSLNVLLSNHGISSLAYHAGMTMAQRDHNQEYWMEDKVRVIIATTAFGMGINKPNVRFVIHYDMPLNLENYYQETGRAGRDGEKSYGILLHNTDNEKRMLDFAKSKYPELKYILNIYNAIGNYYQVPVGTGKDRRFDWDILSFSHNYNLEAFMVATSMKILENSDLISINEGLNAFSKVFISCSKKEVYNFIAQNPGYEPILQILLRLYPFIMIEFVAINENKISRIINENEESIHKSLEKLEKYGILHFDKKSKKPQIIFSENRLSNSNFTLSKESYHQMKEISLRKANEMLEYLKTNKCRQEYLINYFGIDSYPCGKCDNCIKNNKTNKTKNKEEEILSTLKQGPRQLSHFSDNQEFGNKEDTLPIIRNLLDREEIIYKNNMLYIKEC